MFDAQVVPVLIASPGDVRLDRDFVENVIREWNATHALRHRTVLLPLRWELNAVSDLHLDPQAAVNEQLVDHADIVIVLFRARLGTPTPRALSGTVEELERALANGKRVQCYFNTGPVLVDEVDVEQLAAVRQFKEQTKSHRWCFDYATLDDLGSHIRRALASDVARLTSGEPGRRHVQSQAVLAAIHVSTTDCAEGSERHYIEVANRGNRSAHCISFDLGTDDDGMPPVNNLATMATVDIAPRQTVSLPVYPCLGMSQKWRLAVRWTEESTEFSTVLPVEADR